MKSVVRKFVSRQISEIHGVPNGPKLHKLYHKLQNQYLARKLKSFNKKAQEPINQSQKNQLRQYLRCQLR